nr:hypothetical protein [Tanacetum cinerariifolium]
QPPSPQPHLHPHQDAEFPMYMLQELKRRVKKLARRNKVRKLKLRRLQRVGTSQRVETSDETVLDDVSNQGRMIAEMDQDVVVVLEDDKEKDREVADAVKDVKEAKADEILSMQEDETEPAKVQEVVDVVTTAKLITKVVTAASETVIAASAIITTVEAQVPTATLTAAPARVVATPRILVKEPKPLKKKQQIKQDEQYARELHAELNKDIDWDEAIDHVKRKAKEDPVDEAIDHVKGKAKEDPAINETLAKRAAKRRELDEEVEDLKSHLQIVPNEDDDVYTEATPLARKVPVVDYEIIEINNKPYYKIIKADGTLQLYISFLTLLMNFDREDLEALWRLVKERFSTAKPKNFSDDFLLTTLGAMRYPLSRFTLDQMLNVVRLQVEEESKVSLELLRFIRQQHQEGQLE